MTFSFHNETIMAIIIINTKNRTIDFIFFAKTLEIIKDMPIIAILPLEAVTITKNNTLNIEKE